MKTLAIIDDRSAYGRVLVNGFTEAAKAAGIKIVATEQTNEHAGEFGALLGRIKNKQPELIFYAGMDTQSIPLVKQMREMGIGAQFLTGDGGCTGEMARYGGQAAQGAWCSLPGVPLAVRPQGAAFKSKFINRFNADVLLYAPYTYDATMVIAEAIKRAGSFESAKILGELRRLDYQGVTSRIRFDANGDLIRGAVSFYRVRGAQLEYMDTLGGE